MDSSTSTYHQNVVTCFFGTQCISWWHSHGFACFPVDSCSLLENMQNHLNVSTTDGTCTCRPLILSPWQPRMRLKVGGRMLPITGPSLSGPELSGPAVSAPPVNNIFISANKAQVMWSFCLSFCHTVWQDNWRTRKWRSTKLGRHGHGVNV